MSEGAKRVEKDGEVKKDWTYWLGIALLVYSVIPFAVIIALPFMGLTMSEAGAFVAVFVTTGEIAFWIAASLLGKPFVRAFKARIKSFFKRSHELRPVSLARHRAGVALVIVSFLPYYVLLGYLLFAAHPETGIDFFVWSLVAGEIVFWTGLYLLGDQFWDKLCNLFVWSGDQEQG